ncbi:MAG: TolC family protein [Pirellulales bacterium]
MSRHYRTFCSLVFTAIVVATGCKPIQPFYFGETGELSRYMDIATTIDYPDVDEPSLDEVNNTLPPLTLQSLDDYQMWDLSLQEVVKLTLCNSQVIRNIGGQSTVSPGINQGVELLTRNIVNTLGVSTSYDPALVESGNGTQTGSPFDGTGVEAALSDFDARLDASVFWEKNRRPQNRPNTGIGSSFFPSIFAQDLGTFTSGLTKISADGTTWSFRNNTIYEMNNVPVDDPTDPLDQRSRALASDWQTNFEARFSHPLLQGRGVQYNRIAGPLSFEQYAAGFNQIDGVVIARLRTDISLTLFEGSIRDLLHDVETSYWDLYFRYRDLQSKMIGRDSARATWERIAALFNQGLEGGDRAREAQARSQLWQFQSQVQLALTEVYRAERRLRLIMGLSASDGRLIRPADVPTSARVAFDWSGIHCEALTRRVEVRKQKWEIKKRELELIAARNFLLPRVDAVGQYRWLGLGDDLIRPSRGASAFNEPGSTAFGVLTSGEFQEWQLGLQASIPLGFRPQLAGVRHAELHLARERALLLELELEISHQLSEAISDVDLNYAATQSLLSRRVAAEDEVNAVFDRFEGGIISVDLLLDAQRRRAEAESEYYRSLVDYNRAIMRVHYRKGSLLEYDGVCLAEGPWPGKAYFDALRQARKRDAAKYIDYGFTRPNVFSRGPIQNWADGCQTGALSGPMSVGPAPDVATEPGGGGENPSENLPMPGAAQPTTAPPADRASGRRLPHSQAATFQSAARLTTAGRAWSTADEHQTNYPIAATAPAAPVRHGGQR